MRRWFSAGLDQTIHRLFTDRFQAVEVFLFSHGKVLETSSGPRWKPWAAECHTVTKSLLADCGCLVLFPHWGAAVFRTRSSVQRDPSVALLHGLLTSVQPAGSDLCPGKAISALCQGWGCCASLVKWHKLLRGSCVLVMNPSVSWSYTACLLFGCHGWKACVFDVNMLSATFVLLLACISVCTVHAQCNLTCCCSVLQ